MGVMSDECRHPCLIGLDLGTSAVKGVLMHADGRILATAERQVHYSYPQPEWVEADAEHQYRGVLEVIRDLAAQSPGPVMALAAAAASGNSLLADAKGRPLTPVINWMDRRSVGHPPSALEGLTPEAVRQVTGWPCVEIFPLAQLAWLQENHPALYRSAGRVCLNTDWLLFRLTGQWVMDYSTATTFHLQDQVSRRWHLPFLKRLGIAETQLSRLTGSGIAVGPLTPEAAAATGLTTETLAVTGSFDHPSAARAAGIREPGQLLLSCGTSWVGFTPFGDRDTILGAGMLCDPFLSDHGGPWGGIFAVPAIGPVINWYVDNVIAPGEENRLRIFNDLAAQAAPGAGGLVIDLKEPPRPVDADRKQVARAVMEGAARALNGLLMNLKTAGFHFDQAVMVGGPSKSPVWPGILAEITGLNLSVGSAHAGAKGAAMLAAEGAGISLDTKDPSDPSDRSDPPMKGTP
jgi:sugar (pentulose or hexulose) kinase